MRLNMSERTFDKDDDFKMKSKFDISKKEDL